LTQKLKRLKGTEYLIWSLVILLSAVCIYLASRLRSSARKNKDLESKLRLLESQKDLITLSRVESKLNPHLFKNILNSIQSHAYQTYFALDKLANVLDYILYDSQKKFVSPREEIQFALNLIEINKIKISPLFSFNVKIKVDEADPIYEKEIMAPLISTDLIENAFKHADLQSSDSFISITIEFKGGIFSLMVSNKTSTIKPIQKEKSGIGSETLEQRLKLIYRDTFTLQKFVEGDTFTAYLKIDLHEYQAKMRFAG
jgi:LytS/YehU family sensor histidine kinase